MIWISKKKKYIKENYNDYIIAMDLSLTDSGVAVYSLSEERIVYMGNCNTDSVRAVKKYRGYELNPIKLNMQREFFEDIKRRFPPKLVVFERGFARYRNEVMVLNQVNGVVFSIFWNYSHYLYTPKGVKAEIVHGSASKEVVRDVLILNNPALKGNKEFYENDNISDAVAVLYTYLLKNKIIPKSKWNKGEYPRSIKTRKKMVKRKNIK